MKSSASRPLGAAILAAVLIATAVVHATAPAGRYQTANGTVYDTKTKLTWQQSYPATTQTQAAGVTYCANLSLNGMTGWRLPTMKELVTIVSFPAGLAIDTTAFPNTSTGAFWSSTPYAATPGDWWYVDFENDGEPAYGTSSNTAAVRCVHA